MTQLNRDMRPREIELLAPARNIDIAREAIIHGADAVYIGAESFGARAAATNSVDDIALLVDFARQYRARVYVTLNTIIYDRELAAAEALVKRLYRAGTDALIVQDMGLLRMDLPPIALHASTQCDTRTVDRARFLADMGFSQIVLPREMTLDEIEAVHRAVDVPLEAFVHGALCVSYSGDCHAGQMLRGRSANRGECPQICRLPYDLYDGDGNCVERGRHLLSLRDMNRTHALEAMLVAGISSFKIEGRLKDAGYVKNVVAHYHNRLNAIIERHPDRYVRKSCGRVELGFEPAPAKSFNRGFTGYFIDGPQPKEGIASIFTPKSQGERVGTVTYVTPRWIEARLDTPLANGDGLGYFDRDRRFVGFRLNRVEGKRLFPAVKIDIKPGTVLYRNSDKHHDDLLARRSAERVVDVDMTLRTAGPGRLALDLADTRGNRVTATAVAPLDVARTPQQEARRRVLGKLGDTVYRLRGLDDRAGEVFIPATVLTALRRDAVALLDGANRTTYPIELRGAEKPVPWPEGTRLTYHSNVANRLARSFYADHGVTDIEPAAELKRPTAEPVVMTTRYCLRRELGACLRTPDGHRLRGPLTLRSGDITLTLDFDCPHCRMHVLAPRNA